MEKANCTDTDAIWETCRWSTSNGNAFKATAQKRTCTSAITVPIRSDLANHLSVVAVAVSVFVPLIETLSGLSTTSIEKNAHTQIVYDYNGWSANECQQGLRQWISLAMTI